MIKFAIGILVVPLMVILLGAIGFFRYSARPNRIIRFILNMVGNFRRYQCCPACGDSFWWRGFWPIWYKPYRGFVPTEEGDPFDDKYEERMGFKKVDVCCACYGDCDKLLLLPENLVRDRSWGKRESALLTEAIFVMVDRLDRAPGGRRNPSAT